MLLKRLSEQIGYARYRRAQIRQSRAKRRKDVSFRARPFVKMIKTHAPDVVWNSPILCIGPRNEVELDVFAQAGFERVTAIDLWSSSARIQIGDMHALPFPDASFDLIYASHVFEHSYDFPRVVRECLRVLRLPGYLFSAVPVNFETSDHDRYDFRSTEALLAYFTDRTFEVLYECVLATEVSLLLRFGR